MTYAISRCEKIVHFHCLSMTLAAVSLLIASGIAYAFAVYGAIGEKYNALGGPGGVMGQALSDEADAPYGGRFNNFQNGAIYWHPSIGAFAVWGDISTKWNEFNRVEFGYPITDELGTPDGRGRFNHFRALQVEGAPEASIYWTSETGAHATYGAIRDKWARLGWETFLGYPITDESGTPDGVGRFNHFRRLDNGAEASVYWTSQTGAYAVYGAIREKWAQLGWETFLGYPITDESGTPDGVGRFNHFRRLDNGAEASIYWTPRTGARAVWGAIRDKWSSMGWERSELGYPVSDEYQDGSYRRSDFEKGFIRWSPQGGAEVMSYGGNAGQGGSETCLQGYVWRDSRPGDTVCVTPQSRVVAAAENAKAAFRREPGPRDGVYWCLPGFVWREAYDGDTTCVPPHARDRARTENTLARSRTVTGGKEWNVEGEHTLEVGMVATREAWADRNYGSTCGRLSPLPGPMSGMIGWGQAEIGWLGENCMAFVTERAVQFDRALIGQLAGKIQIHSVVLSYEEAEAPSCPLVAGYSYRCWQNGDGNYEVKQNGCVVVHVPSVDWERNGGAYPGRIPYSQDYLQPITRIDNRHWDVTSPVSWQLSSPTPPLGGSSGFGLLLSGWPSIQDLTAQDDTVCVSDIINVALTISYTVLPQGEFHPPN
ncbi:LGFP repeat-containing protein [Rhizobium sp. ZK1]|uniref:LGFP repeat-containing protein n=1 Tax=Rhizobium sp. ZK1 TaxID=3389872 RepID=UPI0039F6AA9A